MDNENMIDELNEEALEEVTGGKSANQQIKATGDLNVRKGPSKDSDIVGTIKKGEKLTFLGQAKADARGVYWYKVQYKGMTCWASSKYSKVL